MMQLVTGGRLKSTTHRVVEYGRGEPKSRYSMPFFLHPSPEIILKSMEMIMILQMEQLLETIFIFLILLIYI